MNIGRFFRLNQSLSVAVKGVVVYDYTGLPAYQGLASDNTMSPKYPVNLVITSDSVRFRMHYCAYKTKWKGEDCKEYYDYQYAVKDVFRADADENNIAHVNEVILELPFVEKPTSDLTDIVKGTYIANFPQVSADKHGRALSKMGHILKNVGDELQRMGADVHVAYCNIQRSSHMKEMVDDLRRMERDLQERSAAFLVCARDLQQIVKNSPEISGKLQALNTQGPVGFLNETARKLSENCGVLRKVIAYLQNPERINQGERIALISKELPDAYNNLQENGTALHQIGTTLLKIGLDMQGSSEPQMTGSRFLDLLIDEWSKGAGSRSSAVSYSTLWLMDLYKDNHFDLYDETREGSDQVTKFLRKLLLDFMFDLKHSSVFNTSPNYDQMYCGLMSNYYFSALMHKCEFYYYRELTIRAVEENLVKKTDDQIVLLYAKELFDAEELWAADVRNPLADKYFEQSFPDDFKKKEWLKGREWTEFCSNVVERLTTTRWDSWFANPEEEMRRIYFVMNEENGVKRICNSIVLAEHLMMDKSEDDTVKAMALSARQNRGNTSRWFLNRYDFNDVLHLHLFKWSNLMLVILAVVTLFILFEPPIPFIKEQPTLGLDCLSNIITAISEWFLGHYILYSLVGLTCFILFIKWGNLYPDKGSVLLKSFRRFRAKRIVLIIWAGVCVLLLPFVMFEATNYRNWLLPLVVIISFIYCAVQFINKPILRCLVIALPIVFFAILYSLKVLEFEDNWYGVLTLVILLALAGFYYGIDASCNLGVFRKPYIHPIESWHIMLPKLVASITTAWLTIAMGFDALAAFFDSAVVWSTMAIIIIVVFSFILYQIDRELPESSSWLKICRTSEMLIISYCLSLCIGVIIVNFVGERYLARSGAVDVYFDEYVSEHGAVPQVIVKTDTNVVLMDVQRLIGSKRRLNLLSHDFAIMHCAPDSFYLDKQKPKFASKVIPLSTHKSIERRVFVIPDFLVMFSFVAMFIGVFLQMVFFDRKKMTEF